MSTHLLVKGQSLTAQTADKNHEDNELAQNRLDILTHITSSQTYIGMVIPHLNISTTCLVFIIQICFKPV